MAIPCVIRSLLYVLPVPCGVAGPSEKLLELPVLMYIVVAVYLTMFSHYGILPVQNLSPLVTVKLTTYSQAVASGGIFFYWGGQTIHPSPPQVPPVGSQARLVSRSLASHLPHLGHEQGFL